jgi:site-specific DNA-methyltransferase (adenine-specific)
VVVSDVLGPYPLNSIVHGDCLDVMPELPDASFDMILCDLPYGTTACAWDSIIPLEPLWAQYKRLIKPAGAIVLFADEPFTSLLIMSNIELFKYRLVWKKTIAANFMNAKLKPLQRHEDIVVFSPGTTSNGNKSNMTYNPQGLKRTNKLWQRPSKYPSEHNFVRPSHLLKRTIEYSNYPDSILDFPNGNNDNDHPTQKTVALFSYLIRTYTHPGAAILDNCAGSGTTAIAAIETGRNWFCIEKDAGYFEIAQRRIEERLQQPFLFEPPAPIVQPEQAVMPL